METLLQAQHLGSHPSCAYRAAYEIWMEYYETTERFDQKECRVLDGFTGHAIPVTAEERRACNKNAIAEQARAWRRLTKLNLTPDEARDAQTRACRDFERHGIRPHPHYRP